MNTEQKLCKVQIFQLQSILNVKGFIDQRFAFKNSGISCLALIYNLNNPRTAVMYEKNCLQVAKYNKCCTVIFRQPMAQWFR